MTTGEKMPPFTATDQTGKTFSSDELKGQAAIIYFYPKNETKVCTAEACSFRDNFEDFTARGCKVIGISGDSVDSHKKFAAHHRLPFTLLSDGDKKLRKLFGVKPKLFGIIPGRETFVFNAKGELVYTFNSLTEGEKHVQNSLQALDKLN